MRFRACPKQLPSVADRNFAIRPALRMSKEQIGSPTDERLECGEAFLDSLRVSVATVRHGNRRSLYVAWLDSPRHLQERLARNSLFRVCHEISQELEFLCGERDRQTITQNLFFLKIHDDAPKGDQGTVQLRWGISGPTKQSFNARQQLRDVERLHQVIVRTNL